MPSFSSEERQLLHDSLHDYFGDNYGFEQFMETARSTDGAGFGKDAWSTYAEMGWLGVALPEAAGGTDGGMTELGIILAAGGHYLALEPLLSTLVTGAGAIAEAGTPEQQNALSEIAAGQKLLAFCHYEPGSGYARDFVQTVAQKNDGGYTLEGRKSFALHAHAVDSLIVSARIGSATGPVALFVVPREAEGVGLNVAPAMDGRRGAEVSLSGVQVDAGARLGGEQGDDALKLIDRLCDLGAIAACAEAVGAMAAVTEQTVEYLKTREQFDQPLSKFQVLQHRLVEMNVSSEEARSITHAALQAIDEKSPDAQTAIWRAKLQTARMARFVGGQAVQLHGGMGMTDELAIGHYYKRLSFCEAMFGDADWYAKRLAETVRI